uniref:Retrovirus-related Pol polyprotein from transposon TNT 1-94-like beta-barrel domain-containing protein n=1 Tax=Solanum lycopersicum TaxID=4081 RepID=A0A3Q7FMG7_SOLLC
MEESIPPQNTTPQSKFYPSKTNRAIAGVKAETVHNSHKETNGGSFNHGSSSNHDNNFGQYLNKDQYANLVEQVAKDIQVRQGSNSATGFNAGAIAGTILQYTGLCFSVFNSSTWIIDSGASEHMCFDSKSFTSLIPLPTHMTITLPNSFRIIVTHTGSVPILPKITLHNDPSMKTTQAFGEMKEGLYLMQPTSTKSEVSFKNNVVSFQKKNNPILQSNIPINTGSHLQDPTVPPSPTSSNPISPNTSILSSEPTRKSTRVSHRPGYLSDYVCNNIYLADLTNACFVHPPTSTAYSFGSLSLQNQHISPSLRLCP